MNFDRESFITITQEEYKKLIASDVFCRVIVNVFNTRKYDSDVIDVIKAFIAEEQKNA